MTIKSTSTSLLSQLLWQTQRIPLSAVVISKPKTLYITATVTAFDFTPTGWRHTVVQERANMLKRRITYLSFQLQELHNGIMIIS